MFSSQRRVGLCCLWKLARRSYQTVMTCLGTALLLLMLLLLAADAPVYEAVQWRQLLTSLLPPLLLQPSSLLLPPPPLLPLPLPSPLPLPPPHLPLPQLLADAAGRHCRRPPLPPPVQGIMLGGLMSTQIWERL